MRVDYDYLKQILDICLDSELPTVDWDSFSALTSKNEHKFVFHLEIMVDRKLIESCSKNGSMGIEREHDAYGVCIIPWRLTANGHDFASSLTKPGVLTTIKEKFKTEGLSVVIDIAKSMASKQAEKLLDESFA